MNCSTQIQKHHLCKGQERNVFILTPSLDHKSRPLSTTDALQADHGLTDLR